MFISFGVAIIVGTWIFREPLRSYISESATLANPAPPPDLIEDMIEKSADRPVAIVAAWQTGKIVHREVAMREILHNFPAGQALPAGLESLVLAGALDVDMDVRESALEILQNRRDPALIAMAVAQLHDCDPQTCQLGLNYLKDADANIGVPAVIPLLDKDNPLLVATALKLLEHWAGQKFDVKLADTVPVENKNTGLLEYSEDSQTKAKNGAQLAKSWWLQHQTNFPPVHLEVSSAAFAALKPEPAADFSLRTLDGQRVRLADLRGKVVLINFWTTWCTACVSEMPELIALQKQHAGQLVVMGVSLDFVPDEDGDDSSKVSADEHHTDESSQTAFTKIREKIARTIKARDINYTILLDENNDVGGRFNGGELPTTVIVDANGNIRRRFIGPRSLPVFEAMIAEACLPAPHVSVE